MPCTLCGRLFILMLVRFAVGYSSSCHLTLPCSGTHTHLPKLKFINRAAEETHRTLPGCRVWDLGFRVRGLECFLPSSRHKDFHAQVRKESESTECKTQREGLAFVFSSHHVGQVDILGDSLGIQIAQCR